MTSRRAAADAKCDEARSLPQQPAKHMNPERGSPKEKSESKGEGDLFQKTCS